MLHLVELKSELRVLCLVLLEPGEPGIAQLLAATADASFEVIVDTLGNQESCVLRPAVELLGQPDLVLAQGLAMGGVGILLVGGAQAMWLSTMIKVGRSWVSRKVV